MKKFATALIAVLSATTATMAHAGTYDAGSVSLDYYAYGGLYSTAGFSAPGNTNFFGYFNVAVAGNQITYTYTGDTSWSPSVTSLNSGGLYVDNGAVISSVSGIPAITSVSLSGLSQLGSSGFNASNITFNAGAVAVSWATLNFATGDTVILDVNSTPSVPEPASWALMITGFGLVGGAMRQRTNVRFATAA